LKKIVISGINIVSGGMLSVYRDCLQELLSHCQDIEVFALVHDPELFKDIADCRITYRAFPKAKRSWLLRCYYEYIFFSRVSKEIRPDVWISMHDMTPNVKADSQIVYCHNPSPFYRIQCKQLFAEWKFTLFTLFYRYLYRINLYRNRYIIVQQDWMRKEFQRLFGLSNIIVARPQRVSSVFPVNPVQKGMLFYPVTVHAYKNVEVLCEATKYLQDITGLRIVLTMDGTESRYAGSLVRRYRDIPAVQFIGHQSRAEVFRLYASCEALLFPSRLESWGMPLSEFMETGKPVLAANLPYAHEVMDGYERVKFLNPLNPEDWAAAIRALLSGTLEYDHIPLQIPEEPYARNWKELFSLLEF
jgi:glycosyltransferase, family 1